MAVKKSKKTKKSTKSKRSRGKSFEYKQRSREQYERSSNESAGNFDSYIQDGIAIFRPHDGANRIRILPPTFEDAEDFALTLLVHYGVGADEQTYLCRKMVGEEEDCAICDEHDRLVRDGEVDDDNDFKQRKRKGIWLIDRKAEEDGALFWGMPFGTWKDVVLVQKDEDGEVIDFDSPEDGRDVLFTKEGAKKRTKYTGVRLGKVRTMLDDADDMDRVLKFIADRPLDQVLNFFDNEHLQAILEGKAGRRRDDDDEEEDEEEEEEEEEEDDDDEEEDEEDEDDEDEKKPAKRSRKRSSTKSKSKSKSKSSTSRLKDAANRARKGKGKTKKRRK